VKIVENKEMISLDENQIEKISDHLMENSKSRIPWIQRKEISAWSGLIFYYAILWSLGSLISDQDISKIDPLYFILFFTCLGFAFFRFIHTQYASIYQMNAHSFVHKRVAMQIIVQKSQFFLTNEIENIDTLFEYINKKIEFEIHNNFQKFRGKLHPLQIVFYFWFYIFIFLFQKIFKLKKRKLNNNEREEAALYSLLVLGFIFINCVLLLLST
jgi:hypothetical protein